jgi:hypothetical protein
MTYPKGYEPPGGSKPSKGSLPKGYKPAKKGYAPSGKGVGRDKRIGELIAIIIIVVIVIFIIVIGIQNAINKYNYNSNLFGEEIGSILEEQKTETNTTRSYMSCFDGTMKFFLLEIMFSPPEVKFSISDLTSPEVKQYISDTCNFYHNKSGVWLSGTDNEIDKKVVEKYGAEFMQRIKAPESIKQRDEAYIQLNNRTLDNLSR